MSSYSESNMHGYANHPLVRQLKAELLPHFHDAVLHLRGIAPAAHIEVFENSIGANTEYQGVLLGISCLLADVGDSGPDEVALVVTAFHLDRDPSVTADVTWGNGQVEFELAQFPGSNGEERFATPARIDKLLRETPGLIQVLTQSVTRGSPSPINMEKS